MLLQQSTQSTAELHQPTHPRHSAVQCIPSAAARWRRRATSNVAPERRRENFADFRNDAAAAAAAAAAATVVLGLGAHVRVQLRKYVLGAKGNVNIERHDTFTFGGFLLTRNLVPMTHGSIVGAGARFRPGFEFLRVLGRSRCIGVIVLALNVFDVGASFWGRQKRRNASACFRGDIYHGGMSPCRLMGHRHRR